MIVCCDVFRHAINSSILCYDSMISLSHCVILSLSHCSLILSSTPKTFFSHITRSIVWFNSILLRNYLLLSLFQCRFWAREKKNSDENRYRLQQPKKDRDEIDSNRKTEIDWIRMTTIAKYSTSLFSRTGFLCFFFHYRNELCPH